MKLTAGDIRQLAKIVDLAIPDDDIDNVTVRLSTLLEAMAEIELELGEAMDEVDPVPPVFPLEDF